jgi:hypothetical protein
VAIIVDVSVVVPEVVDSAKCQAGGAFPIVSLARHWLKETGLAAHNTIIWISSPTQNIAQAWIVTATMGALLSNAGQRPS